jgi:hypothetical protein
MRKETTAKGKSIEKRNDGTAGIREGVKAKIREVRKENLPIGIVYRKRNTKMKKHLWKKTPRKRSEQKRKQPKGS